MFNCSHKRFCHNSFKKTLSILKSKLPPAYPVTIDYVSSFDKVGEFGSTYIKTSKSSGRKKFIITVDTSQCEDMAIETLMHEWAHMISWSVGHNWQDWMDDHGPEFGVAYSRVYQVLMDK